MTKFSKIKAVLNKIGKYKIYFLYALFMLPYIFAVVEIGDTLKKADALKGKTDTLFSVVKNEEVKSQLIKSASDVAGSVSHAKHKTVGEITQHFDDPFKINKIDKYLKEYFPAKDAQGNIINTDSKHRYLEFIDRHISGFFKANISIYLFIFSFIPIISKWAIIAMFLRWVIIAVIKKRLSKLDKTHLYNLKSIYWENFILTIIGLITAVAVFGIVIIFYAHLRYVSRISRGIVLYRKKRNVNFI